MDDELNRSRQQFLSILLERSVDLSITEARPFLRQIKKVGNEMGSKASSTLPEVPVVKLNNGLSVANFSFEDTIIFMDGSILSGCHFDRVKALEPKHKIITGSGKKGTVDLHTVYDAQDTIKSEMMALESRTDIDVVLVSVPVMEALKEYGFQMDKVKARTKVFDKITNTIRTDQFGSGVRKAAEPTSVG